MALFGVLRTNAYHRFATILQSDTYIRMSAAWMTSGTDVGPPLYVVRAAICQDFRTLRRFDHSSGVCLRETMLSKALMDLALKVTR